MNCEIVRELEFCNFALEQICLISELQGVCEHLAMLQARVAARERWIVHAETYGTPRREPLCGHLCPNGHGELPPEAQFWPVCDAKAIDVPPPATMDISCPTCGAPLLPEARFCPACGAGVQSPFASFASESLAHSPTVPELRSSLSGESSSASRLPAA